MGNLRELIHGVAEGTKKFVAGVAYYATKAIEYTAEAIAEIADDTASACHRLAEKFKNALKQKTEYPIYPSEELKKYYASLINQAGNKTNEAFPKGITHEAKEGNLEERKNKINDLCKEYAKILNVEPVPEIKYITPEDDNNLIIRGGYSCEEHTIYLNLPLLVSSEPENIKVMLGTAIHEFVHARQYLALKAWANNESFEQFGYNEEDIRILAINYNNYINPDENYEAYTKQPIEAEARWCAEQLIKRLNN